MFPLNDSEIANLAIVAKVARGASSLTSEQNRHSNEKKAKRYHRRAHGQAIAPRILSPFLPHIKEGCDEENVGDPQRQSWLETRNGSAAGRHETKTSQKEARAP